MGYPLAYFIARLPKKWQQPGLILVMIPFWINFLIRSYAWVIILRTQGVVNTFLMKLGLIEQPLQMLYNDAAVMLGMIYALLPFMVLPIYVSIEQLDLRRTLWAVQNPPLSATLSRTSFWQRATGPLAPRSPLCWQ